MNQLEYLPGIAGQSVQLDGPSAFVGIAEEMRSREWDYDLGYRDLITATRPARKVDVTFNADYATADELRRVADADVMARTPGTFVAQKEWKQRGYILASDVDDIHYGRLSTSLKIALLDGAWWRLVKRSFVPEIATPEYRSATGLTVTASGASGAPLHALTVDGKSVQDGTPTPNAPVPVKVVESRNLAGISGTASNTATGLSFTWEGNHLTVSGTQTGDNADSSTMNLSDPVILQAGETYILSLYGTVVGSAMFFFKNANDTTVLTTNTSTNGQWALTPTETITISKIILRCKWRGDKTIDAYLQLEKGSTATPYMPYGCIELQTGGTITPIDLQGNVLASLPDGTKDVLTVDSAGAVTLEKRVGVVDLGTLTWDYSTTYTTPIFATLISSLGVPPNNINMLCSHYRAVSSFWNRTIVYDGCVASGGSKLNVSNANYTDTAAFKTAMSGVLLYYELATPQTIDLGTIDMPSVPLDAQISVTAAVTPTITAEWQISRDAYLDYPHNYEYDFQATSSTGNITPSVLTPSDVYLAVFGPAVNPYVIVGGNRYQVNVTVPSGGYLVVDGRDKTIQLTLADGTVQNVFSSGVRGGGAGGGSYIFERIPAGTSEVTYDGSFGFDLGWYEEEGEPPWSQS